MINKLKPTDLKPEFTFTHTAFQISNDIWYCGHVCIGIAWMDDIFNIQPEEIEEKNNNKNYNK